MTSIVRIKRKLEDDPADSLLMACKRTKLEDPSTPRCTLKLAGTAKTLNDSLKIVRSALQMERLQDTYPTKRKNSDRLDAGKAVKRARPADDIEVVSCVGALKLEDLFETDGSKTAPEDSTFCLVDLEKTTDKSAKAECVYDIFYVKDQNLMKTPVEGMDFFFYCEEIDCYGADDDEEEKQERNLRMNYFDNDEIEDESYWDKDYPDEYGIFYEKDEDDDDDDDDKSKDDLEIEPESDYGDYLYHFTNSVCKAVAKSKKSSKKTTSSATTMLKNLQVRDDDDE